MNTICPRCGSITDPNSRFCTNCGAVQETPGRYPQSWEAPQTPAQVPSWAQANSQQQMLGGSTTNGSLGFGGSNDAMVKKVLTILALTILGIVVSLILFGLLAYFIPGLRCAFLIIMLLLIFIPWMIYLKVRSSIRRTIGQLWWFM